MFKHLFKREVNHKCKIYIKKINLLTNNWKAILINFNFFNLNNLHQKVLH